jgi:rod shape determining protein RodA
VTLGSRIGGGRAGPGRAGPGRAGLGRIGLSRVGLGRGGLSRVGLIRPPPTRPPLGGSWLGGASLGRAPLGRAPLGRAPLGRLTPVRPREPEPLWRRIDWVLAACALVLSLLGSLLVWSATRPRLLDAGGDPQEFLKRHLVNLAIGVALGALVAAVDYRMLRAYAPIIYVASVVGLIAVLLVGATINGSHSWIVLGGGYQVQPSEFAKVALVVGIAMLLAERRSHEDVRRAADVPLVLALTAVPLGLVLLQPDLGTAMVFVFVVLGVFAVAGVPGRWIVGLVLLGAIAAGAAVQLGVLQDYQLDRFRVLTNPDADTQGQAYNITQARIAIGSGGLFGTGLFKGTQTNGKFVPEQQTDFVFTVAGEELGFIGAGGIILLFGLLLWRALRIAGRSPDLFGRLVAAGVVAWFAFQTFVNIGMTLGIMPVTGLPLPFVSYGGSAMFANWMAIGLLLNVDRRMRDVEHQRI